MASFGSAIRRLRRQKGLSQQAVERLTQGEVKAAWIASLETDRLELVSREQADKLQKIAAVLGVTALEIYREAGLVELPHLKGASPDEVQILKEFRRLPPELKQAALLIIRDLRRATRVDSEGDPEKSRPYRSGDTSLGSRPEATVRTGARVDTSEGQNREPKSKAAA